MPKTITWNGISSTTIPQLVIETFDRQILGSQRGVHVEIDGKEGSTYFPNQRGRRSIVAHCYLLSNTFDQRGDLVEEVAEWLDVNQEAHLILSDRPTRYWEAVLGQIPTPSEWRHLAKFDLEWLAQPYSFDSSITTESWTSDADDDHVWNPGLLMNAFPVIEIKPTNGTLTSFQILANGQDLTYTGNVADDSIITINSIVPTVVTGASTDTMLTGAYNPANVSLGGVDGTFPILIPSGSNQVRFIKLGGTATVIEIDVYYRKKYRR